MQSTLPSPGSYRALTHADREQIMVGLGHHGFLKRHRIGVKVDESQEPSHADMASLGMKKKLKRALKRLYTHRQVWKKEYKNPPQVNIATMRKMLEEKERKEQEIKEKPLKDQVFQENKQIAGGVKNSYS